MLSGISTIIDYISLFFSTIVNSVKAMIQGIALLFNSMGFVNLIAPFMPTFLATAFYLFLGIFIIRFILSLVSGLI